MRPGLLLLSVLLFFQGVEFSWAEDNAAQAYGIDLPTALRLAHAQNLDVEIARQRLAEAKADHASAMWQFLPWIAPGAAFRRHEDRTQAVDGALLDADKQSIALGATLTAQVDLGDALFRTLSTKQLVSAASSGVGAQEQDSTLAAAQGYFDLLRAKVLTDVVGDALKTSQEYERQIHAAVDAGVAFKGDELRVQTQTERYRVSLSQALEQKRIAAARLAQVLHLDPLVELVPQDNELVPLALVQTGADVQSLLQQAMDARPELKQNQALVAAARDARNGAMYGPLIPSLGVQAFLGELGGGVGSATGDYGGSRDYYVGLNWRIGPGGLLDFNRIHASEARLSIAQLKATKTSDDIARQVLESHTHLRSLGDQMVASRGMLSSATETLRLTRQRKQVGVGLVLEDIQAQQELVRARADYSSLIAEFNKAQYVLSKVLGSL